MQPDVIKERPILFSGAMARALLERRKTMTRRVVKPQPSSVDEHGAWWRMPSGGESLGCFDCPYGKPGDQLWVRETWWQAGDWMQRYPGDDEWSHWSGSKRIVYAADRNPPNEPNRDYPNGLDASSGAFSAAEPNKVWRKRPSIHMPRWASRILLEVVSVRMERLQAITEADAIAEGVGNEKIEEFYLGIRPRSISSVVRCSSRQAFEWYWNILNAKRGVGWDVNPWVWVVEFKRVEQ